MKNATALVTKPCAACGETRWRKTYCERKCVATPEAHRFATASSTSSPDPHLHVECGACGYMVLTEVAKPREVAEQRYGT